MQLMQNCTLQVLKVGEFKIGVTHGHQVSKVTRLPCWHSYQPQTVSRARFQAIRLALTWSDLLPTAINLSPYIALQSTLQSHTVIDKMIHLITTSV